MELGARLCLQRGHVRSPAAPPHPTRSQLAPCPKRCDAVVCCGTGRWLTAYVEAWRIATTNSMVYVPKSTAAQQHFESGTAKGNCGCCRPKTLEPLDEGYEVS